MPLMRAEALAECGQRVTNKSDVSLPRYPMTGIAGCCCARAVNGHTAATPTNVMKSRRLIVVGPED